MAGLGRVEQSGVPLCLVPRWGVAETDSADFCLTQTQRVAKTSTLGPFFLLFPLVQGLDDPAGYVVGEEIHRLGIDLGRGLAPLRTLETFLQSRGHLRGQRPLVLDSRLLETRLDIGADSDVCLDVVVLHVSIIYSKVLASNVALCYIEACAEKSANSTRTVMPSVISRARTEPIPGNLIDQITRDALRRASMAPTYMEALDITGAALIAVAYLAKTDRQKRSNVTLMGV